MEYGNDLPITTMGRRIRTRLYFTSESHLHTMLNVLRFGVSGEGSTAPLSESGKTICADAPELCYLTQVIFRVFEDTKREADDPKRYRVEILFSPGATATPMHMAELDRDSDSSRFDSAPPLVIGRDNLSCQEVEVFLDACINEGHTEEDMFEVASMSTTMDDGKGRSRAMSGVNPVAVTELHDNVSQKKKKGKKENAPSATEKPPKAKQANRNLPTTPSKQAPRNLSTTPSNGNKKEDKGKEAGKAEGSNKEGKRKEDDENGKNQGDDEDVDRMAKILARQWYWRGIAIGSLFLGVGCLFLSMNLSDRNDRSRYPRRRFSRR